MIIRLTKSLAMKIKAGPLELLPLDPNPFCDWTANLFRVGRFQVILVSNTAVLYSFLMPGRGLLSSAEFAEQLNRNMRDFLAFDGMLQYCDSALNAGADSMRFSRTNDRQVLGYMNDLVYQAKGYLIETDLPSGVVAQRINETPMSRLNHHSPRSSFEVLCRGTKV